MTRIFLGKSGNVSCWRASPFTGLYIYQIGDQTYYSTLLMGAHQIPPETAFEPLKRERNTLWVGTTCKLSLFWSDTIK